MIDETTLRYITYAWMGVAVCTFLYLIIFKQRQPYGRHTVSTWGPMMSNRWGWVVQEAPSLLCLTVFFFLGEHRSTASYVFWGLWMAHYIHRTFIFPFRIKTEGKKIPIAIVASAVFFNLMNGSLNGMWLGNFDTHDNSYFTSARFLIGLFIFVAGFSINFWADNKLINLRKPGETGYKIPTGGLFNYISAPNHFGEISEWFGFALMAGNPGAWSFSLWAFANVFPRSLDHHRWYKEKFAEYPEERKAVVPFVI